MAMEQTLSSEAQTRREAGTRPRRLAVFVIALREIWRALAIPFHLLAYLPTKHRHQARSRALLEAPRADSKMATRNRDAMDCLQGLMGGKDNAVHHVFIACGESSGEAHSVALVKALRDAEPRLRVSGLGGRELEDLGVELIENIVDNAVMGIRAVLAQLPFYMDVIGRYLDWIEEQKPDLVILVDNPGLNMLLAEQAKKRKIPVLYYICPQYWAWGPWRLRRFAKAVDVAFSILPFEAALFWNVGTPTGFAGHPLLEAGIPSTRDAAEKEDEDILALLPGSRKAEIDRHLLPMLSFYRELRKRRKVSAAIIPQVNPRRRQHVEGILEQERQLGRLPEGVSVVDGREMSKLSRPRLAIVKSGTSCLQTAISGTVQIIVYKLGNSLERFFSKQLLSVPWIAAPNLILGRAALPEFRVYPPSMWVEELVQTAVLLWDDNPAREQQLADLEELRERLAGSGACRELVRWILPTHVSES